MNEAVLDASVAAKFFLDEADSELARSLEHGFDLVAPDLILAELCNLFWKRVRRRDLTPEDARRALRWLSLAVDLLPIEQIAPGAMDLSVTLDHPAYDCFYLALAQQRNLPLLTADERLIALVKAASLDIRVIRLDQLRN